VTNQDVQSGWTAPGYGDVSDASKVGEDLEVTFGNGDLIRIAPSLLGIKGSFELDLQPGPDNASVRILAGTEVRDVSWVQLRVATDPAFARHMREEDANEARRIAHRLKALREDRGLSQRDVAALAGMTSPQLSKIESGTFDLRISTVQALLRAMGANLSDISGSGTPEVSQKVMRKRAADAGVGRELIDRLARAGSRLQFPQLLNRGFGWTTDALTAGELTPTRLPVAVQFKTITSSNPKQSPLLALAATSAQIVQHHVDLATPTPVPDAAETRATALDASGQVTLASLVEWTWKRGIPVIPLHGKRGFCAAVLSTDETHAVVLKESRDHLAYWLFDLAHELGHIALGHVHDGDVVDVDALSPASSPGSEDAQEDAANQFALELLLGDSSSLVREVEQESQGSYLRFKGAVVTVARKANVNAGLLGLVAAFELDELGEPKDRWGSANNLSAADPPGRHVVRDALARQLATPVEPEVDRLLLDATVLGD
jgi:transcriptional regulator with XRE-family HTH domain/Zn-dependent peptidase ImmA (M78 family)